MTADRGRKRLLHNWDRAQSGRERLDAAARHSEAGGIMTEDQIRELLREMRDEPVPPDSLARVRLGVAERGRARPGWRVAAGLLAAACLVLGALLFRPAVPARKPTPAVIARQADVPILRPVQARAADSVKKPRKRPAAHSREQPKRAAPPPGVLIRIENPDDPDVVILFVD
jgi:hypothetical protein